MEPYVLPDTDPHARPGLVQFVQDIRDRPFAAMLSKKLLDGFPHPGYPRIWTVYLSCRQGDGDPDADDMEAVKTFALRVFDRLNLEYDIRLAGTTIYRNNAELLFVSAEADFPRIADTLSGRLQGESAADQWRFRKHECTYDPSWVLLADIFQVVRRVVGGPGMPGDAACEPGSAGLRLTSALTLPSGRTINLLELQQSYTYEGLLEGLPTAEANRGLLGRLPWKHRHGGRPAHLIAPKEELLNYRDPSGEPYAFGTPARLPPILCVARFESLQPAADQEAHASALAVVWFQNRFAFPIDEDVIKAIAAIDWEASAGDFWY
jgi:hypothetical protein